MIQVHVATRGVVPQTTKAAEKTSAPETKTQVPALEEKPVVETKKAAVKAAPAVSENKESKEPAEKKEKAQPRVKIGRKAKTVVVTPAEGTRITRENLYKEFQSYLSEESGIEAFKDINLASSEGVFTAFEKFIEQIIVKYPVLFAGFLFRHKNVPDCFREPNKDILYIGAHKEITAQRSFDPMRRICHFEDGVFEAGEYVKADENSLPVFQCSPEESKRIEPIYRRHLETVATRLEKDEEKATNRKAKILDRFAHIH
jgi:hypothetical protein